MEIRPFRPEDQPAAQALILAGLAAHWGWLDPTLNPDLEDIAASYGHGLFLVQYDEGRLVGTGAVVPEGAGVGRIVRMSVDRGERRKGYGRALLQALITGWRRISEGMALVRPMPRPSAHIHELITSCDAPKACAA